MLSKFPMHNPIRVLIVNNHNRLVSVITTALSILPNLELVGTASNGVEAISRCRQLNPDVVLMELVPPALNGISIIQEIHQLQPHIQIITLSKFAEETLVSQAQQAGAVGNVQLGDSADFIAGMIRNVYFNCTHKEQAKDAQNTESSA